MTETEQLRADAAEDIRTSGAPFQLKRTTRAYNSATSRTEEGPTQTWDGYAADWEYKTRDIDGTLVLQGDVRLIVAALTSAGAVMEVPKAGDTGTYAGQCLNVIRTELVREGGVAVSYVVQLRRP